jgi:hypothetical protein
MTLKSEKLAKQIEALKAEQAAAVVAEREANERELIRLVTAAHCLDDALGYARAKLAKRKAGKGAAQEPQA